MSISNSEQNVVSEMATAIAKMLDSDKKNLVSTNEELSDNEGFFMWVKDGAPGLHVQLNGAGKVPHVTGKDASASQAEMWAAYRRWQERKIIAHTLSPPPKARPILDGLLATAERVFTLRTLAVITAAGALAFAASGITSCVNQSNAVELARANEINKYGFKYSALKSRKVYPDGCASGGYQRTYGDGSTTSHTFASIYECKDMWERWEREGQVWVDWKDAQ